MLAGHAACLLPGGQAALPAAAAAASALPVNALSSAATTADSRAKIAFHSKLKFSAVEVLEACCCWCAVYAAHSCWCSVGMCASFYKAAVTA